MNEQERRRLPTQPAIISAFMLGLCETLLLGSNRKRANTFCFIVVVVVVVVNKAQIRDEDWGEGGLGCWSLGGRR